MLFLAHQLGHTVTALPDVEPDPVPSGNKRSLSFTANNRSMINKGTNRKLSLTGTNRKLS